VKGKSVWIRLKLLNILRVSISNEFVLIHWFERVYIWLLLFKTSYYQLTTLSMESVYVKTNFRLATFHR